MNFDTRQKMIIEACVRNTLCNLLERDQNTIYDFTACLFNINQGGFGKKDYKFDKPYNWIECLKDMRGIIAELDPVYHERSLELGSVPATLPEEDVHCCFDDNLPTRHWVGFDCTEGEHLYIDLSVDCEGL